MIFSESNNDTLVKLGFSQDFIDDIQLNNRDDDANPSHTMAFLTSLSFGIIEGKGSNIHKLHQLISIVHDISLLSTVSNVRVWFELADETYHIAFNCQVYHWEIIKNKNRSTICKNGVEVAHTHGKAEDVVRLMSHSMNIISNTLKLFNNNIGECVKAALERIYPSLLRYDVIPPDIDARNDGTIFLGEARGNEKEWLFVILPTDGRFTVRFTSYPGTIKATSPQLQIAIFYALQEWVKIKLLSKLPFKV